MSEFFRRYCAITAGPPGDHGAVKIVRENGTGHNMKFDIKLNATSAADKGVFRVYNLHNVDRRYFEETEKAAIIFDAGYIKDHGVVFKGKIDQSWTEKEGSNIVTIIEATDFTEELSRRVFSFEIKDEGAKTIISKIADHLGIKIGNVTLDGIKDIKQTSYPLYDGAKKLLNEICGSLNLYWHITDGLLYVAPLGKPSRPEVIKLSSETGLIESPERGTVGIKGKSLVIHTMRPGHLLQVATQDGKSFDEVIITDLNFKGGTFGQEYYGHFESLYRSKVYAP